MITAIILFGGGVLVGISLVIIYLASLNFDVKDWTKNLKDSDLK